MMTGSIIDFDQQVLGVGRGRGAAVEGDGGLTQTASACDFGSLSSG